MSEAQPITGLTPDRVAPYAFLCGDPARVDRIAAGWSDTKIVEVREYRVATGVDRGRRLTAASTGIGAPSTAILVEELVKLGVHTFLRVGNSGGLAPDLEIGDLVITTGALRDDGTSMAYVPAEYPAVADARTVVALEDAAEARGARWRSGISWSLDAFYMANAVATPDGGMEGMSVGGYWPERHAQRLRERRDARVLNMEMESGVVLTLAGIFGLRAGCICVVSDKTPWPGPSEIDLDRNMGQCIEIATDAMHVLADAD